MEPKIDMSKKRRISDVIIDMTSWVTGEVKNAQYPYTVMFKDDVGTPFSYSSKQYKSNGMDNLLGEMERSYNATPLETTKVTVLCPKELLYDTTSPYSGKSETTVDELCNKGMLALDFDITDKMEIDARLQTVLDAVVHSSCQQYSIHPKWRSATFPRSIHHFDRVDNERAAIVSKHPESLPVHEFTKW